MVGSWLAAGAISCQSSTPPEPAASSPDASSPTYQGVFAGPVGSGTIDLSVAGPAGGLKQDLGSGVKPLGLPGGSLVVSGTLVLDSGAIALSGTINASGATVTFSGTVTALGTTLSCTGQIAAGDLTGTCTASDGSKNYFNAALLGLSPIARYCGTLSEKGGKLSGAWNLFTSGGTAGAVFSAGTNLDGIAAGTVSAGGLVSLTIPPSGSAAGTVAGTKVSGTWKVPGVGNGAWSGSEGQCPTAGSGGGTDAAADATPRDAGGYLGLDASTADSGPADGAAESSEANAVSDASADAGADAGQLSGVVAVSANGTVTCALLTDTTVACWGSNGSGELGIGSTTPASSSAPVRVSGLSNVTAISVGGDHVCALLSGGSVSCWGSNYWGQLNVDLPATGSGQLPSGPDECSNTACSTTPVAVPGVTDAVAIAAGASHTCAALAGGSVVCWGWGRDGELGTTTWPTLNVVSGITSAVGVAAGGGSSCALLQNGTAVCWGLSEHGELGDGDASIHETLSPVAVVGVTEATAIAASGDANCAIVANGGVKCWGLNQEGSLDLPVGGSQATPASEQGLSGATEVATAGFNTCVLVGGQVECWGGSASGVLGNDQPDGSCGNYQCSIAPVAVVENGLPLGATAVSIALGNSYGCAVLTDSTVSCWGFGPSGALGNGGGSLLKVVGLVNP
jgi:alpha-tubulin suppressor-like RCC1 family protein